VSDELAELGDCASNRAGRIFPCISRGRLMHLRANVWKPDWGRMRGCIFLHSPCFGGNCAMTATDFSAAVRSTPTVAPRRPMRSSICPSAPHSRQVLATYWLARV